MNYLIVGPTGYIGQTFMQYCMFNDLKHYGLSREEVDYSELSIQTTNWFKQYISKHGDTTIINCAGYIGKPNVDACESAKMDTLYGNVALPQYLSQLCIETGQQYVQISSGCIYTGSENYTEDDKPNFDFQNGSFYSGTKALAEKIVSSNPNAWQFRLRIPFDNIESPRNYITKLLTYEKLIDVENSVSHRGDYVRACMSIIRNQSPYGIYNVVNPGSITTKQVTDMISKSGLKSKFNFFKNYKSFDSSVKTGRSNCTLSTDKLLKYVDMRSATEALQSAIDDYKR